MNARFPRTARILRPREFRHVFDHGRSRSDRYLIVYAHPREEGEGSRLGFVVARRYGNSPRRNAFKRRVREAFRTSRSRLPADHDLVVLPVGKTELPSAAAAVESLIRVALAAAAAYAKKGPR